MGQFAGKHEMEMWEDLAKEAAEGFIVGAGAGVLAKEMFALLMAKRVATIVRMQKAVSTISKISGSYGATGQAASNTASLELAQAVGMLNQIQTFMQPLIAAGIGVGYTFADNDFTVQDLAMEGEVIE